MIVEFCGFLQMRSTKLKLMDLWPKIAMKSVRKFNEFFEFEVQNLYWYFWFQVQKFNGFFEVQNFNERFEFKNSKTKLTLNILNFLTKKISVHLQTKYLWRLKEHIKRL